ncbi:hypothetical protein Patl1_37131 [Pistacia atlantica]|nr:hypothetical protein Patl1_37131 [Pistacia atlantica]
MTLTLKSLSPSAFVFGMQHQTFFTQKTPVSENGSLVFADPPPYRFDLATSFIMQHSNSLPPTHIFPLDSKSPYHHHPSMGWVKVRVLRKVPNIHNLPYFAVKSARLQHSSSLLKERRILENLSHLPEIVQCLGANIEFEHGLRFVYNLHLEYAVGGTLQDLINRSGDFGLTKESDETLVEDTSPTSKA